MFITSHINTLKIKLVSAFSQSAVMNRSQNSGLTVRTFEAINVPDGDETCCNRTTVIEAADVDDDANILGYCYHNPLAIATQWSPVHAAAIIIIIIIIIIITIIIIIKSL
jgi:hypothetical protein